MASKASYAGGFGSGLEVVTFDVDERDTYARDRVTFRVSDERETASADLDVAAVAEIGAVLRGWLSARGVAGVRAVPEGPVSVVRALPYRGHYTTSQGLTVFTCERLDPGTVAAGDTVVIGEVQVPVRTVERDGLGRIVGIVKGDG